MNWIAPTALVLQILLLLYVAVIDIATRLIHNEICLTLALLGIASQFASPTHVTESLVAATILFLLLLVVYQRGWMGGGDVKLLVALAIGLPLTGVVQLLTVTALAGAVLAAGASDDASPALSQASARRIVAPAPRLRSRALAQFAARAAALRGRHSVRRYLDCFQPRDSDMSSALRLSIIMVLLLATAALGLIAYNTYLPKPVVQVAQNAPAPVTSGYFVAAHPLPAGTLARDEDFDVRSVAAPRAFHQGRSSIRPTPRPDCAALWFASSSTPAVPSQRKTSCAREIGASSPASWPRTPAPSASTSTRSSASRA